MSFPASSVVPPVLPDYGMSFRGLSLGPTTAYGVTAIAGVRGMPPVRSGDGVRLRDAGEMQGLNVLGGREIDVTVDVGPPFTPATNLAGALSSLANVMLPSATVEYPLFYAEGGVTYACMARARRNTIPVDFPYALGNIAEHTALQWKATDPRWYSTPTQAPSCGLPTPMGGFGFPITFPLTFGGGGAFGNTIQINNLGNIDCRPILTVTGPCISPSVSNTSISGSPGVTFGVALAIGDQLVIDMDFHTALYFPSGQATGHSVLDTLQTSSTWWTLPPGPSTISFSSADATDVITAAGRLSMQWASAFLL